MAWAAIEPGTGMLALGCAPTEHALAKQVPGANYADGDKIWRAPLSWPAWVALRAVWGEFPLDVAPNLREWAAAAWSDVRIAYELQSAMDAPEGIRGEIKAIEDREIDFDQMGSAVHLRPYQRGGVAWLVLQRRAGLFDPQGNGKCPQSIRAVQVLRSRGQDLPVLIIAANAMLHGWERELGKWAPELTVRVVEGSALRRRQALEGPLSDVYVIAWDTVRLHTRLAAYPGQRFIRCTAHGGADDRVSDARCEVHEKELNAIPWLAVIADEAHRMQDARSKWTRATWWLAHHAAYFWPLTGTPVGDHAGNFWPVGHAIDARAFPSRTKYMDLYVMEDYSWHKGKSFLGLRPDHARAFQDTVQPLFRRIPVKLARPEQPPLLEPAFRYPELSTPQAKLYRQLRRESLVELGPGTTMVPDNTAVKFTRMCQLAYASVTPGEGETATGHSKDLWTPVLPSSKADDVLDFISGEDPGEPLIVYCRTPRLVELIERKLDLQEITHCKIVGGMQPAAMTQSERWFQDGQCRVILITDAGSESITLTRSRTVFFAQPNPSLLRTEQVIGRAYRFGQEYPVRVIYSLSVLDGRPTVDQRLYELSRDKRERAGQVTQDPALMRWIIEGEDQEIEPASTLF